jgi:ribosome-associated protein
MSDDLEVSGEIVIPGRELEWSAARSSGPGGQNVNKLSTKVELRFDLPNTTALEPAVRFRLGRIAQSYLDRDGRILLVSQLTRSQQQNLEDARDKLRQLVVRALSAPKKRKKTRPSLGAKKRRLEGKRKTAEKKQSRRSVRDD